MKQINQLLSEITKLTMQIEEEHPELYQFLDENPDTLNDGNGVNAEVLEEYLNGLKDQLERYKEEHQ